MHRSQWTDKQIKKWWRTVKHRPAPRFTSIVRYPTGIYHNRWGKLWDRILKDEK